ncbi:MAG: branched-chain amino acid ABC transporter permease [Lachnospiraceae bacterium]|nr:branched-chain amino acid ABC transporter permease [Lachnospiraceae bacterium]
MSILLQLLLRSLETGAIYALATLGIIIVFRTNLMINFAQGVMGMFGAYIVTVMFQKVLYAGATASGMAQTPALLLSILAGVVGAILIGFIVDIVIIRRTKKVAGTGKEIITLGMMMIFLGITPMIFGVDPMRLPKVIESGEFSILGANLSYNSLLNIVLGIGLTVLLFVVLQKTKLGLAIRTTASNERTARLMGVPTKWVTLFAWALALVLGTLAGVMIAPSTSVTLNLMDSVQVNAFIACVLGGFQTFYGPVIGAYIIAIANNLLAYYVSSVWGTQILYVLVIIFIVFKPVGLIGKKITKKV